MDTDPGGTQHWAKWAERNGKLRVGNTQLRSRSRLRSRARSSNPGHAPGKIDRTRFRTAAARLLCRARSRRGATRNKSVLRRGAGSARSGWSDVRRRCVPSSSARQKNAKPVQKMLAHFVPSPVTLGFGEGHVHGTLSSIEAKRSRTLPCEAKRGQRGHREKSTSTSSGGELEAWGDSASDREIVTPAEEACTRKTSGISKDASIFQGSARKVGPSRYGCTEKVLWQCRAKTSESEGPTSPERDASDTSTPGAAEPPENPGVPWPYSSGMSGRDKESLG